MSSPCIIFQRYRDNNLYCSRCVWDQFASGFMAFTESLNKMCMFRLYTFLTLYCLDEFLYLFEVYIDIYECLILFIHIPMNNS